MELTVVQIPRLLSRGLHFERLFVWIFTIFVVIYNCQNTLSTFVGHPVVRSWKPKNTLSVAAREARGLNPKTTNQIGQAISIPIARLLAAIGQACFSASFTKAKCALINHRSDIKIFSRKNGNRHLAFACKVNFVDGFVWSNVDRCQIAQDAGDQTSADQKEMVFADEECLI